MEVTIDMPTNLPQPVSHGKDSGRALIPHFEDRNWLRFRFATPGELRAEIHIWDLGQPGWTSADYQDARRSGQMIAGKAWRAGSSTRWVANVEEYRGQKHPCHREGVGDSKYDAVAAALEELSKALTRSLGKGHARQKVHKALDEHAELRRQASEARDAFKRSRNILDRVSEKLDELQAAKDALR